MKTILAGIAVILILLVAIVFFISESEEEYKKRVAESKNQLNKDNGCR